MKRYNQVETRISPPCFLSLSLSLSVYVHCLVMGILSFCFLVFSIHKLVDAQITTEPSEVAAINKLIDYWGLSSKLNLTTDPCTQGASWAAETANPRIACDCPANICRITHLKIYALDISGELPPELFQLTELMDLNLGQNILSGSIPPGIAKSFSSNNFNGPLPVDLGNLTSLEQLYIDSSGVSGPFPQELSSLKSLQTVWASDNGFTGKLPEFFGTFTNLTTLRIGDLGGEDSTLDFLVNLTSLSILYLGSNRLNGEIPSNIITPQLRALNVVGTLVNGDGLLDGFDDDSETLGASSVYTASNNKWAVSNTGSFISNPNGPQYTAQTASQITGTLESELYKTARISPNSLRYYGLGLRNARYNVELHFSEIQMDDSESWKGLGRRLFDGERVLQDFNVKEEARGSKRALVRSFETNVTNTIIDVHLVWAGKGTCCIPVQSTFGPLISAIHVSRASIGTGSSNDNKKQVGMIVGITLGGVAAIFIIASVFYLWRVKKTPEHVPIHIDSPKKSRTSI
ncbi:Malectin [Cynara cardunculus var. scolymus]|uniref:non-specific serine/threonine protein kinase n=1 Tax=Cynara cardunculus var. scolymus TaxID=59895 RepID=A0A103XGG4_CYNCS|nr:Malectin [Cynara cardunculus var. scolymus]